MPLDPTTVAKAQGLHQVVEKLFHLEKETFSQRWSGDRAPMVFCNAQLITCVLFRGDRLPSNRRIDRLDAGRIIDFVSSSPSAFDTWLDASLEIFRVTHGIRDEMMKREANQCARDVLNYWGMVFINNIADKYTLLGTHEDEFDLGAATDRAKSIGERMKAAFVTEYAAVSPFPRILDGYLHQMAALIALRLKEYEIPVDFQSLLELNEIATAAHNNAAVPQAKMAIQMGGHLD